MERDDRAWLSHSVYPRIHRLISAQTRSKQPSCSSGPGTGRPVSSLANVSFPSRWGSGWKPARFSGPTFDWSRLDLPSLSLCVAVVNGAFPAALLQVICCSGLTDMWAATLLPCRRPTAASQTRWRQQLHPNAALRSRPSSSARPDTPGHSASGRVTSRRRSHTHMMLYVQQPCDPSEVSASSTSLHNNIRPS